MFDEDEELEADNCEYSNRQLMLRWMRGEAHLDGDEGMKRIWHDAAIFAPHTLTNVVWEGIQAGRLWEVMRVVRTKSRNIIPDWPRGTSSSKPWPVAPWIIGWGRAHWGVADTMKLIEDEVGDREYHEGQARMMEDWHRSRNQSNSALTYALFNGDVSRPDFPASKRWGSENEFIKEVEARMERSTGWLLGGSCLTGRHYYEPLAYHTWPTYGGIARNSYPGSVKPEPTPYNRDVALWAGRIIAGWEKYGTGTPLDPRTVDGLAREFAKPIELPVPKFEYIDPMSLYMRHSNLNPDTSKMPQPREPFKKNEKDMP